MASNHYYSMHKEIQIPVSYGHIAAKVWGEETAPPVLALHGWQDNAGTFDTLIPLLKTKLYIVAIDSPGQGLSSHKPTGALYYHAEMLVVIKHVAEYFKWDKFNIMGHSIGAAASLAYCSVFPDDIENMISLDVLKPISRQQELLPEITRKGVEDLVKIEKLRNNKPPVYSYEAAKARLIEGTRNEVTPESAEILMKRGTRPSECGTGLIFSRDIRVKGKELLIPTDEMMKAYLCKMRCNLLIISANDSFMQLALPREMRESVFNIYKKACKSFTLVELEGNHFVHLNNPELVAPHIDKFFNKHLKRSKL